MQFMKTKAKKTFRGILYPLNGLYNLDILPSQFCEKA
jgi:hypothetical protein